MEKLKGALYTVEVAFAICRKGAGTGFPGPQLTIRKVCFLSSGQPLVRQDLTPWLPLLALAFHL